MDYLGQSVFGMKRCFETVGPVGSVVDKCSENEFDFGLVKRVSRGETIGSVWHAGFDDGADETPEIGRAFATLTGAVGCRSTKAAIRDAVLGLDMISAMIPDLEEEFTRMSVHAVTLADEGNQ